MSEHHEPAPPNPAASIPIHDRVLLPKQHGISLQGISTFSSSAQIEPIAEAFRKNLGALVWVATMPYTLARHGSLTKRHSQLLASERIKAEFLKEDLEDGPAREAEAARCAAQILDTEEEQRIVAADTVRTLQSLFTDGDVAIGTVELLRQALVLAWSASKFLPGIYSA
jgi:hypothetical protein